MSWYVKRTKVTESTREQMNRSHVVVQQTIVGWVGPIRSAVQASKEANAWTEAGWTASVVASTPRVRAEVSAWQKAADARRAER